MAEKARIAAKKWNFRGKKGVSGSKKNMGRQAN